MKLTGIAKERFLSQFCGDLPKDEIALNAYIIDFFDENGIYIEITYDKVTDNMKWCFDINSDGFDQLDYSSRPEAIESAIIKANEIFNELNK